MPKKSIRIPAIVYTVLSAFALFIWLGILFFAFLLGGSPGPGYERSVPYLYAGIMTFGFLGAVLALVCGAIGLSGKPARKPLPICAALLGAIGSIPFFLMDLTSAGLFALFVGILPSLLYVFLTRKQYIGRMKS